MADENVIEGGGEQVPQLSPIEQKALDQGWRPKEEWDGNPDEWRSAKEFLDRGEFFKKIDDQNRTIKDLRKTQADLVKHLEKVRETEFKRALDELKAQRRSAAAEQDIEQVLEIDDRIEQVREEQRAAPAIEVPQVEVAPELNPIFVAWTNRNGWYETNKAMRAYADRLGNELGASGMSPTDILTEVERQVKKEFAHKFENPNRAKPSAVEAGGKQPPAKKEVYEMSDEERRVMQRFVRQGVITEEQYIKDLKEAKAKGL
jgi:hypothetical protein